MLLSLKNLSLNMGSTQLLDQVNVTIERGERLCLVGRNGAGKSTLMKLIAGEQKPDGGEIVRAQNLRVAQLPQDVPKQLNGSVFDVVASGLGEVGKLLAEYHHLLAHDPENMAALGRVQTAFEAHDGWTLESRVAAAITRLQLPEDAEFSGLSGGLKRRALLARAVVAEPDLLLLDEPTNHLDIESIAWLEEFLLTWSGTLLFVTHDRAFLQKLATRIIEIDRGILRSWPGTYEQYLALKDEALRAEAQSNALFDKKLAQEEVWIRKGIQARRTRDQGRVERLKKLRNEFSDRRNLPGEAKLVMQEAERSGKLVAEAKNVSFMRDDRAIIRDFSTTVIRGDKIGIIGPNGAGKTTLLNLLLGKLAPSSGHLRLGTNLQVAYFDQLRAQLDESKPVYESIGDGKEFVVIEGKQMHVMSYLQNFLFTPDRARSPVKALSGGERSRLLLARLFSQPSNLLVLDEPTNDLDVETLDLLEELLGDYGGTVLLVSHDRAFIDNVVTRCMVYEGSDGRINEYVGGYTDWQRQKRQPQRQPEQPSSDRAQKIETQASRSNTATAATAASKLNNKQRRELEALTVKIEKLEDEQNELTARTGDPEFYRRDREQMLVVQKRLSTISVELSLAYTRWEELEAAGT